MSVKIWLFETFRGLKLEEIYLVYNSNYVSDDGNFVAETSLKPDQCKTDETRQRNKLTVLLTIKMNSLVLVANVLRHFNQEICNQRNNKHLLFTFQISYCYLEH